MSATDAYMTAANAMGELSVRNTAPDRQIVSLAAMARAELTSFVVGRPIKQSGGHLGVA